MSSSALSTAVGEQSDLQRPTSASSNSTSRSASRRNTAGPRPVRTSSFQNLPPSIPLPTPPPHSHSRSRTPSPLPPHSRSRTPSPLPPHSRSRPHSPLPPHPPFNRDPSPGGLRTSNALLYNNNLYDSAHSQTDLTSPPPSAGFIRDSHLGAIRYSNYLNYQGYEGEEDGMDSGLRTGQGQGPGSVRSSNRIGMGEGSVRGSMASRSGHSSPGYDVGPSPLQQQQQQHQQQLPQQQQQQQGPPQEIGLAIGQVPGLTQDQVNYSSRLPSKQSQSSTNHLALIGGSAVGGVTDAALAAASRAGARSSSPRYTSPLPSPTYYNTHGASSEYYMPVERSPLARPETAQSNHASDNISRSNTLFYSPSQGEFGHAGTHNEDDEKMEEDVGHPYPPTTPVIRAGRSVNNDVGDGSGGWSYTGLSAPGTPFTTGTVNSRSMLQDASNGPSRRLWGDGEKVTTSDGRERGTYGSVNNRSGGRFKRSGFFGTGGKGDETNKKRGKIFWIIVLIAILLVVAVAVAIPVAITKKNEDSRKASLPSYEGADGNASESSSLSSSPTPTTNAAPISTTTTTATTTSAATPTVNPNDPRVQATGENGSIVFMDDGTSFVYNNTFGGFWNAVPFSDSAQAQADVPPLNQPWNYETNLIQGVNLGGWFAIEPFIVPALFEPYNSPTDNPNATNLALDEWGLCQVLGSQMAQVIEEHYQTFITEKDFAEIAGAGLNWVRIPIGFWLIETYPGEPFLANVGWTYFLKAISWARKYGIRVNLDLHAVPGSQNGYNHSGKQGPVNFLRGIMGIANAQRTLNYVRTLAEFVSQPEYKNVIPMFSFLNEPIASIIGDDAIRSFYVQAYDIIRTAGGTGAGNGPFITIHDAFIAYDTPDSAGGWNNWLPGLDRVAIDSHPYLCFTQPNNDPLPYQATKPCTFFSNNINNYRTTFGVAMGGEWSLAINDCGRWLNFVGNGQRYDGTYYDRNGPMITPEYAAVGNCSEWNNWDTYTPDQISGLYLVAQAHMDAFQHWFFWTWKTGYSNVLGKIANPLWNYQLGLQQGYIPANPRSFTGTCNAVLAQQGITNNLTAIPALLPWMIGGAGAGVMQNPAEYAEYTAMPTALQGTPVSNFPTFTPTGAIETLPVATPTSAPYGYPVPTDVGDGWTNVQDQSGWFVEVEGCSYPDPWSAYSLPVPSSPCSGGSTRRQRGAVRRAPEPTPASH